MTTRTHPTPCENDFMLSARLCGRQKWRGWWGGGSAAWMIESDYRQIKWSFNILLLQKTAPNPPRWWIWEKSGWNSQWELVVRIGETHLSVAKTCIVPKYSCWISCQHTKSTESGHVDGERNSADHWSETQPSIAKTCTVPTPHAAPLVWG